MPTPPPTLLPTHSYSGSPSPGGLSRSASSSSGLNSPSATRRGNLYEGMVGEKGNEHAQFGDSEKGDGMVSFLADSWARGYLVGA